MPRPIKQRLYRLITADWIRRTMIDRLYQCAFAETYD